MNLRSNRLLSRSQSFYDERKLRGQLKELDDFVRSTPGFHKCSYGAIRFIHRGNIATFSPFVTLDPGTSPQLIWQFMTEKWELMTPTAVISLAGTFRGNDKTWKKVLDETWTVTSGSLPCHPSHSSRTCCLGIIPLSKLRNTEQFFSSRPQGSFPSLARDGSTPQRKYVLDASHTHFILVNGDEDDAAYLRGNLLEFIGAIAVDVNKSATSFTTIPVISVLVSENLESLKIILKTACNSNFPTVIFDSACALYELVQKNNLPNNDDVRWSNCDYSAILQKFPEIEKNDLEQCIKAWKIEPNSVLLFSTDFSDPAHVILSALLKSNAFSFLSMVHLGVAWNLMDTIKTLIHSWKQFEEEDHNLLGYLAIALTYDRAEFLEHLEDLGVNVASSLTIHSLWSLYKESLYNKQFMTPTSLIVRRMLNSRFTLHSKQILYSIGRIISALTSHEVEDLYTQSLYKDHHPITRSNATKMLICSSTSYVEPEKSPHPERDLFIWCIFFGKYKLAEVFWKYTSFSSALSLIAIAIIRGENEVINSSTCNSDLSEELCEKASYWQKKVLQFLSFALKQNKTLTLTYLAKPIPDYGSCSILNLAYATGQKEVVAHHAMQHTLDYIWLGKTKRDTPLWRMTLAFFLPILIPWLHLVHESDSTQQLEGMPKEYKLENKKLSEVWRIGVETTEKREMKKRTHRVKLKNYIKSIYSYVNSPVIKFVNHMVFLCLAFTCMCWTYASESENMDLLVKNATSAARFDLHKLWAGSHPVLLVLTMIYIFGILIDEIRQFINSAGSIRGRLRRWAHSFWNRIDCLMILTFIIGQLLYFFGINYYSHFRLLVKIFFALSLFAMLLRFFQSYYVFRYIGPKVFMIKEMVKDLLVFMYIMIPMFIYYGVMLSCFIGNFGQYKLPTNTSTFQRVSLVAYNFVIHRPVWHIFGEGFSTDNVQTLDRLAPVIFTMIYLTFSVLLMTNLLIAMFSCTFEKIEDNANVYWKYQRFEVVYEFWDRPSLPSPFIVLEDIIRLLLWMRSREKKYPGDKLLREMEVSINDENEEIEETQNIFTFERNILHQLTACEEDY